jgi:MFS family permease
MASSASSSLEGDQQGRRGGGRLTGAAGATGGSGAPSPIALSVDAAKEARYPTRVLLCVTAVALLVNYVETMVIPGVPAIQKDFATTATIASWITSAFLIVGSAVAPLFGKLGDIYGKKRMVLISLTFYTFGVGIAGFSPSIYFLLFARAVQGIGFAIVPLGLAIITDTFPREKIAGAQGIISGTFAIGAAAGLILGSEVVQDLGWQYAFHSAFVLSIVLFLLVWRVIKRDSPGRKRSIDYLGALILMSGVTLLLVYATEGPSLGWLSAEEIALLVPGALLTLLFFPFEARRAEPLIRLDLLRIRNVLVANLIGIVSGVVMFLLFFAIVYYAELPSPFGLSLGIVATGLTLAPATLAMLFAGPFAGRMVARLGPRPILFVGALAMIIGLALFIVNRGTTLDVSVDMVFSLVGIVCTIIPIVNMISISLPRETIAVGLGINTMLRNLGGAIGPVVATAIMATYTSPLIITTAQGQAVTAGVLPNATAFNIVFGIGLALTVVVIVLTSMSKNYTFKDINKAPSPPPATPKA